VPHAWSTGIIKATTLHVVAAMEEAEYMEYCVQTTHLNQHLVVERFPGSTATSISSPVRASASSWKNAALEEFAVAA
jgi:hypothetical protein